MCGIFGGIGVDEDGALRCLENIRRGEDGIRIERYDDVLLGSRRHLVKHSDKKNVPAGQSDQPYVSEDKRVALVFNGELYNFKCFRARLADQGAEFESVGDTEVMLRLYEREGWEFLRSNEIDSLFSLAVLDLNQGKLFITRDWPGRIPLFYFYDPASRTFLFSSELKGFRPLDEVRLSEPVELPPGQLAALNLETFELTFETLYRPNPIRTTDPLDKVGEEFHRLLHQSARHRTMGDVPICTMLSGGIDSLLTTYYVLANIDFGAVDFAPTSYVFAIDNYVSEDILRARAAAEGFSEIGLELKEIRVPGETVIDDIFDIIDTFEMRRIKALSVYPLPIYYYLAPEMRADGFKVTIGGHGADELLGAYDTWKELSTPHATQIRYRSRLAFINSIYENMMRRASIIFMNKGPIEARFPFLNTQLCDYALGIDTKWLSLSEENAEYMLNLIARKADGETPWLATIKDYLTGYLDLSGRLPEEFDDHTHQEMEKLFWKLPLIVAGTHAVDESFLPFYTLLQPKLRGQHGSGLTSLEQDIVDRYPDLGSTDAAIFESIARDKFQLLGKVG